MPQHRVEDAEDRIDDPFVDYRLDVLHGGFHSESSSFPSQSKKIIFVADWPHPVHGALPRIPSRASQTCKSNRSSYPSRVFVYVNEFVDYFPAAVAAGDSLEAVFEAAEMAVGA